MKFAPIYTIAALVLAGCVSPKNEPPHAAAIVAASFDSAAVGAIRVSVENQSGIQLPASWFDSIVHNTGERIFEKGYAVARPTDQTAAQLTISIDSISAREEHPILRVQGQTYATYVITLSACLKSPDSRERWVFATVSSEKFLIDGNGLDELIINLAKAVIAEIPSTTHRRTPK